MQHLRDASTRAPISPRRDAARANPARSASNLSGFTFTAARRTYFWTRRRQSREVEGKSPRISQPSPRGSEGFSGRGGPAALGDQLLGEAPPRRHVGADEQTPRFQGYLLPGGKLAGCGLHQQSRSHGPRASSPRGGGQADPLVAAVTPRGTPTVGEVCRPGRAI